MWQINMLDAGRIHPKPIHPAREVVAVLCGGVVPADGNG